MALPQFLTTSSTISWSSAATITSPIFASSALLNTLDIIYKSFIFNKGLPGSLVADSREGIMVNVFIDNWNNIIPFK